MNRNSSAAPTPIALADVLAELTISDVRRAYSGRPGCGCGCRGQYREGESLLASRNLAEMRKRVDEVGVQRDGAELIFSLEDDKRYRWLYVPAGPVEMRLGQLVAEVKRR